MDGGRGVNKSVKVIIWVLYLVINVFVQGAAGANKNPASGVVSNIGRLYREIYYYGDNKRDEI